MGRGKIRSGFSLLEVLVAMALSSALILLVANFVSAGTSTVAQTKRVSDLQTHVTAFTEFLQHDFAHRVSDEKVIVQESTVPESGWRRDQIGFFLRVSREEQFAELAIGDLCFVVYFVEYSTKHASYQVSRKFFASDVVRDMREREIPFEEIVKSAASGEAFCRDIASFDAELLDDRLSVNVILVDHALIPRMQRSDWESAASPIGRFEKVRENEFLHEYSFLCE